jgi:hypothetical protein
MNIYNDEHLSSTQCLYLEYHELRSLHAITEALHVSSQKSTLDKGGNLLKALLNLADHSGMHGLRHEMSLTA